MHSSSPTLFRPYNLPHIYTYIYQSDKIRIPPQSTPMSTEWNKPPAGYKPGQTRAPLIWNIAIPLSVVAVFLGCLRFYVRTCLLRMFGKDDWLLLAAVIFLCSLVGGLIWETVLGIGKHQYDLDMETNPGKYKPVCCYPFTLFFFFFCGVPHLTRLVLTVLMHCLVEWH